MRALGLEPSLFPGKSRVPHPSGVTRAILLWVGKESNLLCERSRLCYGQLHPMARPTQVEVTHDFDDDAYAVVKGLMSGTGMSGSTNARTQARKESNPRPSVLETAASP